MSKRKPYYKEAMVQVSLKEWNRGANKAEYLETIKNGKNHSCKKNQKSSLRSVYEKNPKCQTKKHELVFSQQQAYEGYERGE